MDAQHNIPQSSSRQIPSALAPDPVNRGRYTEVVPNRYFLGESLAILLCRASNGKVFGVTIDREDLSRVLSHGTWRIFNFNGPRRNPQFYCACKRHGRVTYLHRFILNAPPKSTGIEVDHIHHRTMDNRKSEIRLATRSQNQRNRKDRIKGAGVTRAIQESKGGQ